MYYSAAKGDKNADPERKPNDQAPSAILELVDGPKDMRFAMTARTVAHERENGRDTPGYLTALNVRKVTRYRDGGIEALEDAIQNLKINRQESTPRKAGDTQA